MSFAGRIYHTVGNIMSNSIIFNQSKFLVNIKSPSKLALVFGLVV